MALCTSDAEAVERGPGRLPPILVVDDDRLFLALVVDGLVNLGLANPIETASTIRDALSALADGDLPPVVVFLDLSLPDGKGFDLLAFMRASPRFAKTSIVVLTGSDELDDVDHAYELGVASYLQKAIALQALGDIMQRLDLRWAALPASGS